MANKYYIESFEDWCKLVVDIQNDFGMKNLMENSKLFETYLKLTRLVLEISPSPHNIIKCTSTKIILFKINKILSDFEKEAVYWKMKQT